MTGQGQRLRILVVDDHAVVRRGLRAVLADEEGLEVIGEASNSAEAVSQAGELRPDVILMYIRLAAADDASGIEACRQIKETLPKTQVIMFTSYGEKESVLSSILAGATGFLTKNVSHARLVEVIRAAGRGESLLDPRITRHLISRLTELTRASENGSGVLSKRESEVLRLVAQGLTNKEIAAQLYLSPFTVRNQVIRILDKLGLSRRAEAAAEAVRLGLLR